VLCLHSPDHHPTRLFVVSSEDLGRLLGQTRELNEQLLGGP
jgi:hypothetical protein